MLELIRWAAMGTAKKKRRKYFSKAIQGLWGKKEMTNRELGTEQAGMPRQQRVHLRNQIPVYISSGWLKLNSNETQSRTALA